MYRKCHKNLLMFTTEHEDQIAYYNTMVFSTREILNKFILWDFASFTNLLCYLPQTKTCTDPEV